MVNLYAAWIGIFAGCIAGAVQGLFFHKDDWFGGGIPNIWKPFAICDVAFIVLFFLAHVYLAGAESQAKRQTAVAT